jgi:hypothetical protein
VWESERAKPLKGPLVCYLVANLMRYCRMTEEAAYNTGFAAAHWYLLEAKEGDDLLVSSEESSVIDMLKQFKREQAA